MVWSCWEGGDEWKGVKEGTVQLDGNVSVRWELEGRYEVTQKEGFNVITSPQCMVVGGEGQGRGGDDGERSRSGGGGIRLDSKRVSV